VKAQVDLKHGPLLLSSPREPTPQRAGVPTHISLRAPDASGLRQAQKSCGTLHMSKPALKGTPGRHLWEDRSSPFPPDEYAVLDLLKGRLSLNTYCSPVYAGCVDGVHVLGLHH
jgi:hypothetical protein